jgi:arabinosyltransferase A/arabinosyltransferase B/arabinosyltransferase C
VLPLAAALTVAGATAAVTPGGVMAAAPVLAGAVPLLRGLRARTDLHVCGVLRAAPLVAALVAAGASALLLMAADQGPAALTEAVRVRGRIGGGLPWYEEFERYALLLTPGDVQGAIGRRAAVLGTLLAAGGLARLLAGRERSGVAAGAARRLLVTLGLSAVGMMISPTKWTQHFGALTGLGTAVLTLGLVVFGRRALAAVRDPATTRRRRIAGLAGATVVCGLVLAGQNMWPFVSGWYTPTFSTVPPQVRTVPVATIVLAAGGAVVIVLLAWSVWRRSAEGDPGPHAGRNAELTCRNAEFTYQNAELADTHGTRVARWCTRVLRSCAVRVPAPATPVAVVLAAVMGLQVLSLARIATVHRDGYTPTADALASVRGDPCGLQSALQVETDPAAGVLAVAPQPAPVPGIVPAPAVPPALPAEVDVGGATLPGIAVAGTGATPWFTLDGRQRTGTLPVVVTVTGTPRPGDVLNAAFARGAVALATVPLAGAVDGTPTDRRLLAPPGTDRVRLAVTADVNGAAVVSLPRAPVLTPMTQVLPRSTRALLDWPVAFVFPCLDPEPLPPGTASLPQWRVAPPADDPSAEITYTPGLGGPFAGPRLLVTQRRMPTYLRDDPVCDGVQLYRWEPVEPMRTLTPTVRDAADTTDPGHLRVPQLVEGG